MNFEVHFIIGLQGIPKTFVRSYLRHSFQNFFFFWSKFCLIVKVFHDITAVFPFTSIKPTTDYIYLSFGAQKYHSQNTHTYMVILHADLYTIIIYQVNLFSLTFQSLTFCTFHPSAICIFVPKRLIQLIG